MKLKKIISHLLSFLIILSIFAGRADAESAKKLPISYNTSTYGNATRDYTSLTAWEAATDNDLVAASCGEVLDCYDDAASFDDHIKFESATCDNNCFRMIRAASGEEGDGTPNNGVYICYTG